MSKAKADREPFYKRPVFFILVLGVGFLVAMVATYLVASIAEHKAEKAASPAQIVALDETVTDPAVWGQNFPIQYEGYLATAEDVPSLHAGVMVEHDVEGDPRTEVKSSKLEEDPRLVTIWGGYPFSKDYRHLRGHAYMMLDQEQTLRNKDFNQPGTCANCHASMPAVYEELGDGDPLEGFEVMGTLPLGDVLEIAEGPIACIDCHDPQTMDLVITRPALINGLAALKKSEGIDDYDVNRDATRQEMRSYVCAQCHVEYYFAGEDKVLTFPWAEGLDIDDITTYYENIEFRDWEQDSGAQVLKAQHPEFDIWANGVHAQMGVSCADCHMPYERVGSNKVSNHQITTPMVDVNASCGTCHKGSVDELTDRVRTIQDRFITSRDRAMDALVDLIGDIQEAEAAGDVSEEQLNLAREFQNTASFYVDYVYSENSYGFHAPDYEQRILSQSLDFSRKGQLALKGYTEEELKPSEVTQKNLEASWKLRGATGTSDS